MITLKSAHEIELMRRAGKITAAARAVARDMVKPGVTTQQIDKAVYKFITEQGATPSFLHYNGYPASVCVSVNDEIIHGIPGKRVLQEGDIVGYIVLGKGFGGRTTYVSLLMSGLTWGLERIIPMNAPMTSQPLMELIFAVSLPAVGSAILFNLDASSGGTDIVAMILRKYTSLNIGRALMCSDLIITLMACVAFGMETGLFCILGLVIKSLLVDMVLENINTHKYFHIITTKPREIEQYITNVLKRGATELHGEGAYTHEGRTVLMTVMKRHEAIMLRKYVKMVDPHAFVLIMNTGEIIGKGFRGTN